MGITISLFSVICIVLITIANRQNQRFLKFWNDLNLSFTFLLILPTFFLFSIPFQTNFNFLNTLKYAPESIETKLTKIVGNENYSQSIMAVKNVVGQKINKDNKILFLDTYSVYASFYSGIKPTNLLTLQNNDQDLADDLNNTKLRYIFTTNLKYMNYQKLFSQSYVVYQNPDYVLLEIKN